MPIGVNLLPWRETMAHARKRRQRLHLLAAFMTGLALTLAASVWVQTATAQKQNLADQRQSALAALNEQAERLQTLRQTERHRHAQLHLIQQLSEIQESLPQRLAAFNAVIPPGIQLLRLETGQPQWRVVGRTRNADLLPRFMNALHQSRLFADPVIQRVDPDGEQTDGPRVRFEIMARSLTP